MADASAPEMAKLILDEVTGEQVSKTELKRRQKQRQKEEGKKKKEAEAPPKPLKKESGEAEEKDLNPNVRETLRVFQSILLTQSVAIFRNSFAQHSEASSIAKPKPIPTQVSRRL